MEKRGLLFGGSRENLPDNKKVFSGIMISTLVPERTFSSAGRKNVTIVHITFVFGEVP